MAKCAICDKSRQTGHRISINRSQVSRRANKTWNANVKKVKVVENGTVKSINVCTDAYALVRLLVFHQLRVCNLIKYTRSSS